MASVAQVTSMLRDMHLDPAEGRAKATDEKDLQKLTHLGITDEDGALRNLSTFSAETPTEYMAEKVSSFLHKSLKIGTSTTSLFKIIKSFCEGSHRVQSVNLVHEELYKLFDFEYFKQAILQVIGDTKGDVYTYLSNSTAQTLLRHIRQPLSVVNVHVKLPPHMPDVARHEEVVKIYSDLCRQFGIKSTHTPFQTNEANHYSGFVLHTEPLRINVIFYTKMPKPCITTLSSLQLVVGLKGGLSIHDCGFGAQMIIDIWFRLLRLVPEPSTSSCRLLFPLLCFDFQAAKNVLKAFETELFSQSTGSDPLLELFERNGRVYEQPLDETLRAIFVLYEIAKGLGKGEIGRAFVTTALRRQPRGVDQPSIQKFAPKPLPHKFDEALQCTIIDQAPYIFCLALAQMTRHGRLSEHVVRKLPEKIAEVPQSWVTAFFEEHSCTLPIDIQNGDAWISFLVTSPWRAIGIERLRASPGGYLKIKESLIPTLVKKDQANALRFIDELQTTASMDQMRDWITRFGAHCGLIFEQLLTQNSDRWIALCANVDPALALSFYPRGRNHKLLEACTMDGRDPLLLQYWADTSLPCSTQCALKLLSLCQLERDDTQIACVKKCFKTLTPKQRTEHLQLVFHTQAAVHAREEVLPTLQVLTEQNHSMSKAARAVLTAHFVSNISYFQSIQDPDAIMSYYRVYARYANAPVPQESKPILLWACEQKIVGLDLLTGGAFGAAFETERQVRLFVRLVPKKEMLPHEAYLQTVRPLLTDAALKASVNGTDSAKKRKVKAATSRPAKDVWKERYEKLITQLDQNALGGMIRELLNMQSLTLDERRELWQFVFDHASTITLSCSLVLIQHIALFKTLFQTDDKKVQKSFAKVVNILFDVLKKEKDTSRFVLTLHEWLACSGKPHDIALKLLELSKHVATEDAFEKQCELVDIVKFVPPFVPFVDFVTLAKKYPTNTSGVRAVVYIIHQFWMHGNTQQIKTLRQTLSGFPSDDVKNALLGPIPPELVQFDDAPFDTVHQLFTKFFVKDPETTKMKPVVTGRHIGSFSRRYRWYLQECVKRDTGVLCREALHVHLAIQRQGTTCRSSMTNAVPDFYKIYQALFITQAMHFGSDDTTALFLDQLYEPQLSPLHQVRNPATKSPVQRELYCPVQARTTSLLSYQDFVEPEDILDAKSKRKNITEAPYIFKTTTDLLESEKKYIEITENLCVELLQRVTDVTKTPIQKARLLDVAAQTIRHLIDLYLPYVDITKLLDRYIPCVGESDSSLFPIHKKIALSILKQLYLNNIDTTPYHKHVGIGPTQLTETSMAPLLRIDILLDKMLYATPELSIRDLFAAQKEFFEWQETQMQTQIQELHDVRLAYLSKFFGVWRKFPQLIENGACVDSIATILIPNKLFFGLGRGEQSDGFAVRVAKEYLDTALALYDEIKDSPEKPKPTVHRGTVRYTRGNAGPIFRRLEFFFDTCNSFIECNIFYTHYELFSSITPQVIAMLGKDRKIEIDYCLDFIKKATKCFCMPRIEHHTSSQKITLLNDWITEMVHHAAERTHMVLPTLAQEIVDTSIAFDITKDNLATWVHWLKLFSTIPQKSATLDLYRALKQQTTDMLTRLQIPKATWPKVSPFL